MTRDGRSDRLEEDNVRSQLICGAVRYTVAAPFGKATAHRPATAANVAASPATTGAAADAPKAAVTITGEEALRWYHASYRRSAAASAAPAAPFCSGTPPMKRHHLHLPRTATSATGTRLARHIYVADKDDGLDIADGLPQEP